jgi:hypothetical protein
MCYGCSGVFGGYIVYTYCAATDASNAWLNEEKGVYLRVELRRLSLHMQLTLRLGGYTDSRTEGRAIYTNH